MIRATQVWRRIQSFALCGQVTLWLDCARAGPNRVTRQVLDELNRLLDVIAADMPDAVVLRARRPEGLADGLPPEDLTDLAQDMTVLVSCWE